jgi:uncharacterized membrane protein YhaH (DUF805 family)
LALIKKTKDMKKYFHSVGKEKNGPISLDVLKQENITKDTLIWVEGLDDWTPAGELDEMKPILELQPPPIISGEINESKEPEEEAVKTIENFESQSRPTKKGMFSSLFSFDGRIRRTEYGISLIIYVIVTAFVNAIVASGEVPIIGLAFIPILWFLWAQGAKRCHDVGNNGWWQIIPFYIFWLLFQDGQPDFNEYGHNPKG